jgi:N-acetylglucosamine kinase-like BadF-type ATPase
MINKSKKYVMGIDGGGTKSHLALFDEDGKCVTFATHGPLNHESMEGSYDELQEVLPEFLLGSLKEVGVEPKDLAYSVFGLAGVDTKWQHEFISGMITKAGFERFELCNDGFLGVAAGCPADGLRSSGAGICAINGTGSTMAAIDYSGNTFQLGGMGVLTDDCGGSTWFGEQVLATVYNSLFKFGKPTLMNEMMFEKLGINDKNDYLETLWSKLYTEFDINDLNRFVFEALSKKDEVAADIIKRSCEHYAGGIAYLAKTMNFPEKQPLQIALAGSIFVKEKIKTLPKMIRERVYELVGKRRLEFNVLDMPPVAGAVIWASREASFGLSMKKIEKGLQK